MQPNGSTPRRILVVDDEEFIRAALDRTLRKVGYDPVLAETAEEALEALRSARFSLVLTDLRMSGIGGHALVREVSGVAPETPVVVMSGTGDMQDVIECLRHGVVDFVPKPFVSADLSAAIERALQRAGQRPPEPRTPHEPRSPNETSPPVSRLHISPFAPARIGKSQSTQPPLPPSGSASTAAQPSASDAVPGTPTAAADVPPPDPLTQVLSRLRSGALPLPKLPEAAMSVRELLGDEEGNAGKMRALLEGDPALAARVIRLANTGLYPGTSRLTELRAVVSKIGFREVGYLVGSLLAHRFHIIGDPELQPLASDCWTHAWSRAIAMRLLATAEPNLGIPAEEAFVAGLFCDVGRPFLLKVLSGTSSIANEQIERFVSEQHASVGAAILESWDVPYAAAEVARLHHDPQALSSSKVLQLLWAVEPLCIAAGTNGEGLEPVMTSRCRAGLALQPRLLRETQATLNAIVEESEPAFAI